ncbi:MAG: WD40 repeat domain-containing protein, partial [Acidobacteria bacterium]|nr:WD40 repeat domain-containing protein [Acidobacteriota bacterium]
MTLSRWQASDGRTPLGSILTETAPGFDATHSRIAWGLAGELLLQRLDSLGERPTLLGRHREKFHFNNQPAFDPKDRFVAGVDDGGNVILWSLRSPGRKLRHFISPPGPGAFTPALSRDGTLVCLPRGQFTAVWRLEGVAGADPIRLGSPDGSQMSWCGFHPKRPLVATLRGDAVAFWELSEAIVMQLRKHDEGSGRVAFSPDSRYLYSLGFNDGSVIRFPLRGALEETETLLDTQPRAWSWGLAVDPRQQFVIATTRDRIRRIPLDGSPATTIGGLHTSIPGATVDPTGRILASSRFANGARAD